MMPPFPEGRTRLLLWTAVLVLSLPGLLRGVELSQRQPAAAPDASLITRIVANQQAAMKRCCSSASASTSWKRNFTATAG